MIETLYKKENYKLKKIWENLLDKTTNEENFVLEIRQLIIKIEAGINEENEALELWENFNAYLESNEKLDTIEDYIITKKCLKELGQFTEKKYKEGIYFSVLFFISDFSENEKFKKLLNEIKNYSKSDKLNYSNITDEVYNHLLNDVNELIENNLGLENSNQTLNEYVKNEFEKKISNLYKKMKREKNKNFGEWLKEERLKRGYSLNEFAEKCLKNGCGISSSYINRLEKGVRKYPSIEVVEKISIGLNLNFEEVANKFNLGINRNIIKDINIKEDVFIKNNQVLSEILNICIENKGLDISNDNLNKIKSLIKHIN